jgi:hypothetical protein
MRWCGVKIDRQRLLDDEIVILAAKDAEYGSGANMGAKFAFQSRFTPEVAHEYVKALMAVHSIITTLREIGPTHKIYVGDVLTSLKKCVE